MKLSGNTVLITGAGTGMGLEAAQQLDARGNRVIMVARNEERLRREAEALEHATAFACDISDETQVDALLAFLEEHHPELNVVLLNAGITHSYALFDGQDAYAYAEAEMRTNYLSAVRLTQRLAPALERHEEAALIVTTSGVAFAPDIINPTYSATKAALHSLVQSIRLQLERNGSRTRVFELMAPLVDSPFSAHVVSDQKVSPESVISALLAGLERDELELRVGISEDVYQALRASPDGALRAVNAATGG